MEIWGSVVVLQAWECGWMPLWHWGNAHMQLFRCIARSRHFSKWKMCYKRFKRVDEVSSEACSAAPQELSCKKREPLSSSLPFCILQPMQAGSKCASDKSEQWQRRSGSSQRSEDRWRAGKACSLLQGSSVSLFTSSALYLLLRYSMSQHEQSRSLRPVLLLWHSR